MVLGGTFFLDILALPPEIKKIKARGVSYRRQIIAKDRKL